ncbi:MAG: maltose/moltooligosaccharide transporter [Maribacter sp.]|jgi:maltose/moltooligosaccharide transporter
MRIETLTFVPIYKYVLRERAINAIFFAGVFCVLAAILPIRLSISKKV